MPAGRPVEAGDGPPAEERILAATLQALARLDPGALTIQAICRDAEVTPPTLYYHFGSKDGLVAAAIERLADDWTSLLDVTVPRRGDLEETLATAEQGWLAMVLSPGRPLAVIAWVTLLSAQTSDRARTALVRARERTVQLTSEAILPHVGDAEQAADLAAVVIDGVVAAALDHHLDGDVPALHRRLSALMRVVRAVVAQSQRTPAGTAGP